MGRSAKMMKRPTKAERVSRALTAPKSAAPASRPRSLSPDLEPTAPSAIPLFNTSAKRRKPTSAAQAEISMQDDGDDDEDTAGEAGTSKGAAGKKGGKNLKERVKAVKDSLKVGEDKSRRKTGVLGGADYLKLHEKRPGGTFRKKFR